jgi:hypothetical protein
MSIINEGNHLPHNIIPFFDVVVGRVGLDCHV